MIILCGNRRLTSDKYQWRIEKKHVAAELNPITGKKNKNPGEIYWNLEQPAYPMTLALGLEMVYDRLLKDGGEIDVSELAGHCKDAAATVTKYCEAVKKEASNVLK